jgi:hypothetical protein
MSRTDIFTEIYTTNAWGSQESVSGPGSTLAKTEQLRVTLPHLCKTLQVKTLADIGCGDWNWMRHVDLSGINYAGFDIVEAIVQSNTKTFSSSNVCFAKYDCFDLLFTAHADLWLVRDVLGCYSFESIQRFFQTFRNTIVPYLALTSVATDRNINAEDGSYRPLNFELPPFSFTPTMRIGDDTQWFRKKELFVLSRQQILNWLEIQERTTTQPSTSGGPSLRKEDDRQDRNAHLTSNVRLRDVKVHGHMR